MVDKLTNIVVLGFLCSILLGIGVVVFFGAGEPFWLILGIIVYILFLIYCFKKPRLVERYEMEDE